MNVYTKSLNVEQEEGEKVLGVRTGHMVQAKALAPPHRVGTGATEYIVRML